MVEGPWVPLDSSSDASCGPGPEEGRQASCPLTDGQDSKVTFFYHCGLPIAFFKEAKENSITVSFYLLFVFILFLLSPL